MTFKRTAAGIANYPAFTHADLVLYIEGRGCECTGAEKTPADAKFYEALLRAIAPSKTIKIKCVGNKETALSYANAISRSNEKNSLVIVDRDYDGVMSSLIDHPAIVYTRGYSWESDLWNLKIAAEVLNRVTISHKDAIPMLTRRYVNVTKRLRFLSSLDASLQAAGRNLLPKNKGSCGVDIKPLSRFVILRDEIARLTAKYRNDAASSDTVCVGIREATSRTGAPNTIQGHLWCHVIITLIAAIYKKLMAESSMPNAVVYNLILGTFSNDGAKKHLESTVFNYYRAEITARI